MLVLLMKGVSLVCCRNGLRWCDIRTKPHYDRFRHSSNIMVLPQQFQRLVLIGITNGTDL
jgi:hypothetical protein